MPNEASVITVRVEDHASRDRELDLAISALCTEATDCGVLMTRIEFTTYIVALSPHVPFGVIQEADLL